VILSQILTIQLRFTKHMTSTYISRTTRLAPRRPIIIIILILLLPFTPPIPIQPTTFIIPHRLVSAFLGELGSGGGAFTGSAIEYYVLVGKGSGIGEFLWWMSGASACIEQIGGRECARRYHSGGMKVEEQVNDGFMKRVEKRRAAGWE